MLLNSILSKYRSHTEYIYKEWEFVFILNPLLTYRKACWNIDLSDNIFIRWWNFSYLCGSIYTLNKILYKRYTVWLGVGVAAVVELHPWIWRALVFWHSVIKIPAPAALHTQWALLWAKKPQEHCFPSGQTQITQLLPTSYHIIYCLSHTQD